MKVRLLPALALTVAVTLQAQIPNTLKHSIPPPPTGAVQPGSNFGHSVATNGTYTVVGALLDDLGAGNAGVAKVFDAATGVLLFTLPNPTPAVDDQFGHAVAMSGTRVVVSAIGDDTGASNAGSVYVFDLSGANPFVPVLTLNNPAPAADDMFGISVAISGTRIAVGTPYDDASGTDAGTVYEYDLTSGAPTVPVLTISNPTPAAGDFFGNSMAMEGTRLAVAAYWDDTAGSDAGAVYVFDLAGGTPATPVVTLASPAPAANDGFGEGVAISGSRVAVGATADDITWPNGGAVHVFDLSSGTPTTPVFTIGTPTLGAFPGFGQSVAFEGSRLVVGTPFDDTGATNSGAVFVYDLSSGTPTVPALTIANPTPANGDWFGFDVALAGAHLATGARFDDTGAADAGSAYFYNLSGATPTVPVITLSNPTPATLDYFGFRVAASGTRVVVGMPYDSTGASSSGIALVYDTSSPTPLVPVAVLPNPTPAVFDSFGLAVAISGSLVAVGAPDDDTGVPNAGSVYIFDLTSPTPSIPAFTLNHPAPAGGGDSFGGSVSIAGTRVVVGVPGQNVGGVSDIGLAYVYDLAGGTPTVPVLTLSNPTPAADDNYGIAVAISGTRVVVGAYRDDTGANNAGSAYVYDLASGSPATPVFTLNDPTPTPGAPDYFGQALALDGSRLIVSTYNHTTVFPNDGRVYLYDLAGGTPTVPALILENPSPASGDQFGIAVSISGTLAVVGCVLDDTGATDTGIAYVFDLGGATPGTPAATLVNPTPLSGDYFGYAVAISGSTVVVGAPLDDSIATDEGYVYVYGPASGGGGSAAPLASALGDVISGALAPDAGGAGDGTKYDVLRRGAYFAENGQIIFPGSLLIGTGGVTLSPNTFMGLWKHDGTSVKLFARGGNPAPEADGALFDVLPQTPAINDSGEVTFLASLVVGSGSPATTVDTDTGLWSELGSTGLGILIREGDVIPGVSGGPQVGSFASGCFATAHTGASTGEAAFALKMKGSSTDTAILRASITGPTVTAVGVVARENTAMPGVAGEQFGNLAGNYTDSIRMDSAGNLCFVALSKTGRESIWYQPSIPAGSTAVKAFIAGTAATGDTAPGTGATFKNIKSPSMGSAGTICFRGFLNTNGDNTGGKKGDGIWRGTTAGGFTCILRAGDDNTNRPGLGLPAGAKVGNVWHGWLTNANHIALRAWLDVNGNGISSAADGDVNAIFTDLSGTMTYMLKAGDPAPGISGAAFVSFGLPVVGGAEQYAILANVTGGGATPANNWGIWRSAAGGGSLTLVLRTGDPMTTTQGVKTILKVDFPDSGVTDRRWEQPVMDATGRLIVIVTFTDGATAQVLVP
ncbi:MAG: FG-GAP repeat protein [Verrucomicrobiaceae bacterium]|nr:FG-GAP repeat protein [Verrucomicrobiaceae bacterium]